jgi:hypothetical protein
MNFHTHACMICQVYKVGCRMYLGNSIVYTKWMPSNLYQKVLDPNGWVHFNIVILEMWLGCFGSKIEFILLIFFTSTTTFFPLLIQIVKCCLIYEWGFILSYIWNFSSLLCHIINFNFFYIPGQLFHMQLPHNIYSVIINSIFS